MTTEQQIEQRIINIITSPKSTIRCVKDSCRYKLIVSSGKKEILIDSYWMGRGEKMWAVIYRKHLWGLFKTEIFDTFIYSRDVFSVLRPVLDKKEAEEAEKRKAQAEKKRHAILSFLNTKP